MALQVGELFALITADDSPFQNALKNVEKSFKDVGQKISGIGQSLTMGVTAPIAGLTAFGVKYNSTMEDLQTSFEVMLGSQEKAKKMTQDLIKMGAATPFESTQLADYTKTLLSFGVASEQVLPLMGRIGDVSLGNSEKMSSLVRTMGQISALGKLQGGDLNQLIGQGWNPLNEIMKKTGETTEQIRDRMSKGAISYKEVEDALVSATSKGGMFYKGMEKGSQTFSGQLSTLKDTFSMLMGELTKPIFDELKASLPKVIDFVSKLGDRFKSLSPTMKKTILIVAGIAAAIGPLLVVLGTMISSFGVVAGAIGALASPITLIVVAIAALVAGFVYLWTTNEQFRTTVIKAWDMIVAKVQEAMAVIMPVVTQAFQIIQQVVTDVLGILLEWWNTWGQGILESAIAIFTQVVEWLTYIFNELILPLVQQAMAWFQQVWNDSLKSIIEELLGFIGRAVTAMQAFYQNVIAPVVSWLLSILVPIFKQVFSIVGKILGDFLSGAMKVIQGVLKIFNGLIDFITGVFTGNWGKAWEGVKKIFSGIFDSLYGIVKVPLNMIIRGVNKMIGGLNKVQVPDWVPGVGGKGINIKPIPELAKGGIVDKPTLAMIGEGAEAEAVIPLSKLSSMLSMGKSVGKSIQFNITGNYIANDYSVERIMNQATKRLRYEGVY